MDGQTDIQTNGQSCYFIRLSSTFNSLSTICWLVSMNILSFIGPIRDGERKKNCLMFKFVLQHFLRLIIIGWTSELLMIWSNWKWCKKASSVQGVKWKLSVTNRDGSLQEISWFCNFCSVPSCTKNRIMCIFRKF